MFALKAQKPMQGLDPDKLPVVLMDFVYHRLIVFPKQALSRICKRLKNDLVPLSLPLIKFPKSEIMHFGLRSSHI